MTLFSNTRVTTLTREADKQRDLRNWVEAAELYGKALDLLGNHKNRFRFLVQRGNCLKEAGEFDGALVAYDEAQVVNKSDSDLHLQRGHLFKLMQRTSESAAEYQLAFNLDSTNEDARREVERCGGIAVLSDPKKLQNIAAHTIWLDVTDFVVYVQHNSSLSGIQRVLANLALYLKHASLDGYRVVPVIPEYDTFRIFSTSARSFIELVEEFDKTNLTREDINVALAKVYADRVQAFPEKDDVFVVAGAFWIYPHYDCIMHLRQTGMRFGLFIHDLIQIRMPEYVQKEATDQFNIQISDALDIADFVLANSEYVASDIRAYISEKKNYTIPVKAVVLPTELRSNEVMARIQNRNILDVAKTDYVISVSTIEIRKNHPLLLRTWEKLREEFGEQTPNLVLVGKWGWEIDEFRKYVEEKGYIGDWLFIFNGISDNEMEYLYKNSMFSVYPSFAEGFGLPIGESLVYGKPCIASNTTSMPEVGGDFVRYIDPFDWEASYPTIRQVIADRDDLARWQDRVKKDFKVKTWHQFSAEFYDAVVDNAKNLLGSGIHAACYLPQAQFVLGGTHDILRMARTNEKVITFRSARHAWWHPANHWGAWSQNRRSEIQFISECGEGDRVELFLRLHRESNRESDPTVILNAGDGDHAYRLSEHPTVFRFTGIVTGGGVVRIFLLGRGKFPSNDQFIGWSGIAYCKSGDSKMLAMTYGSIIPVGKPPLELPFIPSTPVILP